MEIELPTFLVTMYCVVDDLYKSQFAPHKPVRPGRRPALSDSEVLTLALLAQWQAERSERAFLRLARRQWRGYFPRLLTQSAFNRRVRDLAGVLCAVGPALAAQLPQRLGPRSAYEVLDGVPVPLMRCCRGKRHRLFGSEAALGRGGSDHDWYYGVKLFLAAEAHGLITGFVFGPANTEERWLADSLLRWRRHPAAPAPSAAELAPLLDPLPYHQRSRQGPTGVILPALAVGQPAERPYVADLGLTGRAWVAHWHTDYGATVLTRADFAPRPTPDDQAVAQRWFHHLRQRIETVNATLCRRFGLQFPQARSLWGLRARLGAKVAAYNLAVSLNLLAHRPAFAIFDALA